MTGVHTNFFRILQTLEWSIYNVRVIFLVLVAGFLDFVKHLFLHLRIICFTTLVFNATFLKLPLSRFTKTLAYAANKMWCRKLDLGNVFYMGDCLYVAINEVNIAHFTISEDRKLYKKTERYCITYAQ